MKKILLSLMMTVCLIGPRAHATPTVSTSTKTFSDGTVWTVAEITLQNAGELSEALENSTLINGFQYLHLSTYDNVNLNDADLAALATVNACTIEMQHVKGTQAFSFSNSNVEYFILPYDWTKEEVNNFAQANISSDNFKACLSTSATEGSGDATLVTYLRQSNTLADAIAQMYFDTRDYATLGNGNKTGDCSRLKKLVVMGHFCARDISRAGNYDENGHYVINGTADENNQAYNKNTDGDDLYTPADNLGALNGCYVLEVLDLSGGLLQDAYSTDIVIAYNGIPATQLKEVWIPEDPSLRTIPADFLNVNSNYLHQICIPSNIEIIRTRAFAGSGCRINYVWTKDITGTDTETRFDNGAYYVSGSDVTQKYMDPRSDDETVLAESDKNNFTYGTMTLPPNLKLIERFAFAASNKVKDVYCLNTTAPECHVDAFSTVMYVANNTLDKSLVKDGVVTRDAYSMSGYEMATVLHYPRETTTPDIQRYIDPTREYSIATGERDGNGNMIYFPNHSEMSYSYLQASSGYVWKAWDDSRNWYDQEISLGYGNGLPLDQASHITGNGNRIQENGNNLWTSNTYAGKKDRSFYDVTTGDNNAAGEVSAPAGLDPYYNTVWQGSQLYPQAEMSAEAFYKYVEATEEDFENGITVYTQSGDNYTESTTWTAGTTYYKRIQNQKDDGNGNLLYTSCDKGHFVKDYRYEPATNGAYVEIATPEGYKAVNSPVEGATYYSDSELTNEATPLVGNGFWYQDGMKNVYTILSDNDKQGDIRDHDQYYYEDGTNQDLYFGSNHTPLWYPTDETETVNICAELASAWSNASLLWQNAENYNITDIYVNRNGKYVLGMPSLNGSFYVKNGNTYDEVTVLQAKETQYYGKSGDYYYEVQLSNVQISEAAFYSTGTTEQPVYASSDKYLPGKTWYEKSGDSYNSITKMDWWNYARDINSTTFYYLSGSEKNIVTAESTAYDPAVTYYTDAEGTIEAETVTFDQDYYIQDYTYTYVEYTGSEEGTCVDKVEYYREATAEELANTEITHYCPEMEDVAFHAITKYNDYRGWHQFVLTGYGYNAVTPMEPLKFFINDNDWWTICEPYDLRYSDMIRFFGTEGSSPKLPYLSKLMYVVRDVENQKITLMFSKNLMEYKEQFLEDNGSNTTERVHGVVDDETQWTTAELEADPIILHAGVPYLIRPNLTQQIDEETGESYYVRQFDTFKSENEELYNRLKAAQDLGGSAMNDLIYNGEYTVPAYVVGYESPDASSENLDEDGELAITMKDGTTITYQDSKKDETKTISYGGKEVKYRISDKFKYTFVGSFFKSVMPQYSYFLGWDSKKNCAAFWYSADQDLSGWNWNNETGIIMPNFDTSTTIHTATGADDPARWTIVSQAGVSALNADDFAVSQTGDQNAKSYTMEIGGTNFFDGQGSDDINSVDELPLQTETAQSTSIYTVSGSYVGSSERGLAKGVYIRNGKKLVVK